MKTKPILFSTPMVQAILDGRKTQTRRVIKPQPEDTLRFLGWELPDYKQVAFGIGVTIDSRHKCPYEVGDILWVREKFRKLTDCRTGELSGFDYYAAMPEEFHEQYPAKWKPSIHMPKAAARIFLEITDVRVEKLQDIVSIEAIAEGIQRTNDDQFGEMFYDYKNKEWTTCPIWAFQSLWYKINGEQSWNANPWVWVLEFKQIDKPQNWPLCDSKK